MTTAPRLLTLIAELTYACPQRCAYCSNPTHLTRQGRALSDEDWMRVIDDAEALGALQVHFTGGEPLLYGGLARLVARARERELYVNLVTSGSPLSRRRLAELAQAGLEHLQLSIQAPSHDKSIEIAGVDLLQQKLKVAAWAKELGLQLTINIVLHRENVGELSELLALAEGLEPHRIELANVQYLGWALSNRARLMPSREELESARRLAAAAQERLKGRTDVLFVLPDYYAERPRACMGGWAQSYMVVTPDGLALPCHAARAITGLHFDDVRRHPLAAIWREGSAFQEFRGTDWHPEPCRSCPERHKDFGGCRCQAFALTGDTRATDPACSLSPHHGVIREARGARAPRGELLTLRRAPSVDRNLQ
ncbi:MAG: pyrroloquinoline quinone biosynthesis protein PqqE [Sorangiineae bacterium NIC37A_2]|nr:MAG: pyrroloquinoline quinone biosynthesis protein PqqE [Sorangiineae bacterium NIC37A_2]